MITCQVHHPIDKTSTPQNRCNVKELKFRNTKYSEFISFCWFIELNSLLIVLEVFGTFGDLQEMCT